MRLYLGNKKSHINFIYQFENDFLPGGRKNVILKKVFRALDSQTWKIEINWS